MKIVLLPGMDGTGLLFKDFIRASPLDCLVLSLPESGEQSHKALSEIMVNNLPTDAYALVAESFSGGLVPYLIQSAKVKPQAIIFVASFLHSPRPLLAKCVYYLPWKILLKIPGAKWIVKYWCMNQSSENQFQQLWTLLCEMDMNLMKRRLFAIRELDIPEYKTDIPTLCLMAAQDKLVPYCLSNDLVRCFSRLKILSITGPHFLMQANPDECATEIVTFMKELEESRYSVCQSD